MSQSAIRARGLGKVYRLGAHVERYSTFRDAIVKAIKAPAQRLRSRTKDKGEDTTLWALRNVDFDIAFGEVVGVIGRNGAGKSTLLKILSRITEPTYGSAEIRGRVGSLLEVGTGFHLELTGRENIYLNGAILGMRRAEIERKFDEMVDFAGVEKFIDTPVKHYSSGMYLRLAFAVAAHLEPEILLVDEVLAVGDAAFQKKCIGKMNDVAAQGRTVLFVSHNLGAVKELCTSTLVMCNGEVDFRGPVSEGLARYSRSVLNNDETSNYGAYGWHSVRLNGRHEGFSLQVNPGDELTIEAQLKLKDDCQTGYAFAVIEDAMGETIIHLRMDPFQDCPVLTAGTYSLVAMLPPLWLAPGVYTLYAKFRADNCHGGQERYISDRVIVEVNGSLAGVRNAVLAPAFRWELKPIGKTEPVGV